MTIQQYKQQLYDACKEHSFFAQQALDRYDAATTDQERERARIDNTQHLAACHALQWALDKATDFEQQLKQAQIDILNKLKERIKTAIDTYFNLDGGGYYLAEGAIDDIDGLIEEVENENRTRAREQEVGRRNEQYP